MVSCRAQEHGRELGTGCRQELAVEHSQDRLAIRLFCCLSACLFVFNTHISNTIRVLFGQRRRRRRRVRNKARRQKVQKSARTRRHAESCCGSIATQQQPQQQQRDNNVRRRDAQCLATPQEIPEVLLALRRVLPRLVHLPAHTDIHHVVRERTLQTPAGHQHTLLRQLLVRLRHTLHILVAQDPAALAGQKAAREVRRNRELALLLRQP